MDYRIWLRDYVRHPIQLGSVFPSSAALSDLIVDHIKLNTEGMILELGAGTGRVTNAILRKGIKQEQLVLVEKSPEFSRLLRSLFPGATVLCADALELDVLSSELGVDKYDEIVSGIPLRLIPANIRATIFSTSLSLLRNEGSFSQLTFFPKCPIPETIIQSSLFKIVYAGMSFRNFPPGFVWRVQKL